MAELILRMGNWNCLASGGHYIEVPSAGPEGMAYVYINTVGTIAWANTPPAPEATALGGMSQPETPKPKNSKKKAAAKDEDGAES